MRDTYHEDLDAIGSTLVVMTTVVGTAIGQATAALLHADTALARRVIAEDDMVDLLRADLDRRAMDLLATQQPVAGDLRRVVTSLRIAADVERMGDLAQHIAKVAKARHPRCAVPAELHDVVAGMGRVAQSLAEKAAAAIEARDAAVARELPTDDNAMDMLHGVLLAALVDTDPAFAVQTAIDAALIGRYYERYADHAVNAARRLVFQVTGVDERATAARRRVVAASSARLSGAMRRPASAQK